ncbi:MAG: single-stranded-DNA-specific exonuclease RecJ [bacterium]|nr:single-stranded-DNA-specific exonuclease RecJ [bacterium]
MIKNKIWKLKSHDEETISRLGLELGFNRFFAVLLNSKGVQDRESARSFLNPDLINDLHNPFLFRDMQKAVDRIRKALEAKEKIFIYGDRDVDGVSSSAMVYRALKKLNGRVEVFVPSAKDGYGINTEYVEQFKAGGCNLIITVDNGISEFDAVKKAVENGMDVIITDHHTPGEKLPEALAVLNPKCEENYPFKDLAGVGVAYKLLCGIFLSYSQFYDREIVVLDLETTGFELNEEIIEIGAVKYRNFIKTGEFHKYVKPPKALSREVQDLTGITEEQLQNEEPISRVIGGFYEFIKDAVLVGHNITGFDIHFLRRDIKTCLDIKIKNEMVDTLELARSYLHLPHNKLESVAAYFHIKEEGKFHGAMVDARVTYEIFKKFFKVTKKIKNILEAFSEYAVLGSIADVVPLRDENRLIVRKGLEKLKSTDIIGLEILLKKLNISQKTLTARALSWKVIPILNAAGRMGIADKALKLLISDSYKEAEKIVDELLILNQQRKDKQQVNFDKVMGILEQKVDVEKDKIFIIDIEDMEHGVTGVIANRILEMFYRPVVILILKDGEGVGTARSIEQFKIFEAFKQCRDLFIDFGGHKYAVGFSIKQENLEAFKTRLRAIAEKELKEEDLIPVLEIDAEISLDDLTVNMMKKMEQLFEPFGEDNDEPLFLLKDVRLYNVQMIGSNKKHLKLRVGKDDRHIFDALFWGGVAQGKDFAVGEQYHIVFRPEINTWNNKESVSLIIEDVKSAQ